MRIVCSHEHFVALNLPFCVPPVPSDPPSPTSSIASSVSQTSLSATSVMEHGLSANLSDDFRTQHFLIGILLSDLATMLQFSIFRALLTVVRDVQCARLPNVSLFLASFFWSFIFCS